MKPLSIDDIKTLPTDELAALAHAADDALYRRYLQFTHPSDVFARRAFAHSFSTEATAPEPIHIGPPIKSELIVDADGILQNYKHNATVKFGPWFADRFKKAWRKAGIPVVEPDADGVTRYDFAPPGAEPRELAFAEEIIQADDPNFTSIEAHEIERFLKRIGEESDVQKSAA